MQRIIIFANGELPRPNKIRELLRPDDFVICADGGTRHALGLHLTPNLVIGDMDSIQKEQWQELQKTGVAVEIFPRDKNETDLELAIERALELGPREIMIVAALGGRLDQTFGNIALLTDPRLSTVDVRLDDGVEEIFFCRDQAEIQGRSGDIVSLIPWGNPVHDVQTQELKWPLIRETLYPEKTRGISNEMLGEKAAVHISAGILLVIHRRQTLNSNI
ncbi:MAG TPA: thiamine diphosphokinase [Anaerolineales bacterium]|nr:thiamine diphosphokinase [Anaerolineales bacterium]